MSDRYQGVFYLPQQPASNAYAQIVSGALLWDQQTGQLFAQLQLSCTTAYPLRAITAQIQPLSAQLQPVAQAVTQIYQNPPAMAGVPFGQQILIPMPAGTASFSVSLSAEAMVQAPVQAAPIQAQPSALSSPAPVGKFIAILPLLAALLLILLDPLVYCLQIGLFRSISNGHAQTFMVLFGNYLFSSFYTNTILLISPLAFWLLCMSRTSRTGFTVFARVLSFVILGLQLFMTILLSILQHIDLGTVFGLRSFISYFPGSALLIALSRVSGINGFRLFLNAIWELLYFVPTLLSALFSFKLKRK